MSRIGKNPVTVPDDVSVEIAGQVVTAKGKLGELTATLVDEVEPFLLRTELVIRTPRGRMATNLAAEHIGIPLENEAGSDSQGKLFEPPGETEK